MHNNQKNMTFLTKKIVCTSILMSVLNISKHVAQQSNIQVVQDSKFEILLNEKRKLLASTLYDDKFKIQIFNGSTDEARRILTVFRQDFPHIESTVVFNTPSYKVIAGNFKSRIAAEYELINVRKSYKNAILIRPRL